MAPEAALGETARMDERADVYGVGVILHLILTGELPFAFSTIEEWLEEVVKEHAASSV